MHLQGDVGAAWLFSGLTTSPQCWEWSPEELLPKHKVLCVSQACLGTCILPSLGPAREWDRL